MSHMFDTSEQTDSKDSVDGSFFKPNSSFKMILLSRHQRLPPADLAPHCVNICVSEVRTILKVNLAHMHKARTTNIPALSPSLLRSPPLLSPPHYKHKYQTSSSVALPRNISISRIRDSNPNPDSNLNPNPNQTLTLTLTLRPLACLTCARSGPRTLNP